MSENKIAWIGSGLNLGDYTTVYKEYNEYDVCLDRVGDDFTVVDVTHRNVTEVTPLLFNCSINTSVRESNGVEVTRYFVWLLTDEELSIAEAAKLAESNILSEPDDEDGEDNEDEN